MDLSLLLLVFSLIFTIVSTLLLYTAPLIKTSRLKMESFSTVRDTQRGSQSYMETREEGDRGVQEDKRGNQKEGDRSSQ